MPLIGFTITFGLVNFMIFFIDFLCFIALIISIDQYVVEYHFIAIYFSGLIVFIKVIIVLVCQINLRIFFFRHKFLNVIPLIDQGSPLDSNRITLIFEYILIDAFQMIIFANHS